MGLLLFSPASLRNIEVILSADPPSPTPTPNPIHSYTTYDDIRGHILLTTSIPQSFSSVEISLLGTIRTTHPDHIAPIIAAAGTQHVFLKLTMPLPPSAYLDNDGSETHHLAPGQPLKIPFHFVVPARLLPVACTHDLESPAIHDAHLQPPPSLGNSLLPRDDLTPEMASVTYGIHAKIMSVPPSASSYPQTLASTLRKIHVVPTSPEAPPLSAGKDSSRYVLSKTKSLRRGVFKGKLGTLTLTTTQPRAFSLPPPPMNHTAPTPSTLATLTLRFDPADPSCLPPRLGALTAKIRATTVHSIRPARGIPDEETRSSPYEIHNGAYSTQVSLASHEVTPAAAPWTYVVPAPAYERRDSGYSTAESEGEVHAAAAGEAGGGKTGPYYTATIPLPLNLPGNKTWVPTFHSCLVSRFYTLMIRLMVHPPGKSAVRSSLALKVPVQVLGQGRAGREEAFEAGGRAVVEGAGLGWEGEGGGDLDMGGVVEGLAGDELPGYVTPATRLRRR
ncbi:hypothetical protein VC83_02542 [Pseudogymnoascus destructans]|uniref:Arrestin-like N-terminal domain-containing protein n=2 Tax=Pseudogymnoascus destructans TaxID=655981 RepID=L8FNA3_PSED2|nr:uncharacterized protein VC83_02542 [Pseudogymnoascus destructans]ELR02392.1 hypothetical protein GMDG_05450 [Pseudogymnoascus destructans 20631-21]OAF60844.1 hypothetical protein VC83_02542 [Pseudogymnoascus destructans]